MKHNRTIVVALMATILAALALSTVSANAAASCETTHYTDGQHTVTSNSVTIIVGDSGQDNNTDAWTVTAKDGWTLQSVTGHDSDGTTLTGASGTTAPDTFVDTLDAVACQASPATTVAPTTTAPAPTTTVKATTPTTKVAVSVTVPAKSTTTVAPVASQVTDPAKSATPAELPRTGSGQGVLLVGVIGALLVAIGVMLNNLVWDSNSPVTISTAPEPWNPPYRG